MCKQTVVVFVDGREIFRSTVGGRKTSASPTREAADGRAKIAARFANIPFPHTSGGQHENTVTVSSAQSVTLSDGNSSAAVSGGFGAASGWRSALPPLVLKWPVPSAKPPSVRPPTRDRIFVCVPKAAAEERACAEKIATQLAAKAYRPTGERHRHGQVDVVLRIRSPGNR
ncbi:MAG: hypothetical protein IPM70_00630 [Proteobacteria bacterium]|nr:hypothetical protein [Pseudomonadota bacterium]